MKLRIWHFVTPTPTAWQEDKPADDNGTAEYFLDGCVAAHRTASNGWQTSPTRTPQRIWFLENIAGGPPEDIDGAWVRCYFDPQSGRWVALGSPAAPPEADVDTPIKFTATAPASFCRPHQVGRVWGVTNNSTFFGDFEEAREVSPRIGAIGRRTIHQRRYPAAFTCEPEETIGADELRVAIDGDILSQVHILNPSHRFADLAAIGFGDEFFPILLSCSYGRYRLRRRIRRLDISHPLGAIELWSISDEVRPSDLTFRFVSDTNGRLAQLGPDRLADFDPDQVFLLGGGFGIPEISVSYHPDFENDAGLPNQPEPQVYWDLNVQFSQRLVETIPLRSPDNITGPGQNFSLYIVERERIRILVNGSPLPSGLPSFDDGTFDSHRSTRLVTGASQANRAFFSFNRKFFTNVGDVITIERNGEIVEIGPSPTLAVALSGTAKVVRRFGPHGLVAGGTNDINGVLPQEYLDTFTPYADADWHWGETEDRDDCPEVLYVDANGDPQNWDLDVGAAIDRAATIDPLPPQLNADDFEYSIDTGTLPPGLTLEDDGTISGEVVGTPGASGSFIIAARTRSYYLVTNEIEWTIN